MAGISQIRDRIEATLRAGLADAAAGLEGGLSFYRGWPGSSPNLPAIVVTPASADLATDRNKQGLDRWEYVLLVLVSDGDNDVAQEQLDEYLAKTGPNSIRAAIQADKHLGLGDGTCAYVTRIDGYGDSYGSEQDLTSVGASLRLMVTTNG